VLDSGRLLSLDLYQSPRQLFETAEAPLWLREGVQVGLGPAARFRIGGDDPIKECL
jgi:hypothetical protein